jgi:phospholipid/cholesterol/gamma-HCH transport system substrate-binding protein
MYLNPALATTSRLFTEINRDTPLFRRFITANADLVTNLAERRNDLAGLVTHLATTTGAINRVRGDLGDALHRLPPFMARANTTFVNLRRTLDDLRPTVEASKPAARKLRPFLAALRPFARDARPTVQDLAAIIRRPGPHNDLIELTGETVPFARVTTGTVTVRGKRRRGSFPVSAQALKGGTPELAYARPWAPDLLGWFDDFSNSGVYDAIGSLARVSPVINAFSINAGSLIPLDPALRAINAQQTLSLGQYDRCPGSLARGAAYKPTPDYPCDPSETPPGP